MALLTKICKWTKHILGEFIQIKHGWAFKGEFFSDTGSHILLTPGNFKADGGLKLKNEKEKYYTGTYPQEYLLSKGDFLTVMTDLTQTAAILGSPAIIPDSGFFLHNQRLGKISIISPEIDKGFLYHLMNWRCVREQIKGSATGSTVRHTAPERICKVEVSLPPLPIQKKISAILSAYDDLIENNEKRIKILEEMAQKLYREWFVNYRFPGHQKVNMADSAIGKIPEGWTVNKLGDVADIKWGDTSTTKASYVAEGFDAYSAAGLDGKLDHYDFDREGIVISAIGANCGKTWYVKGKWSCIKNTIRFWSINSKVSVVYLYFATQDSRFWTKRGAAQPFISQTDARNCLILLPFSSEMTLFSQFAENCFNQRRVFVTQTNILRQTRDMLLPKLISGEVDVSDLDIEIPEAVL
jgi:type I restriction enzyme S subunit